MGTLGSPCSFAVSPPHAFILGCVVLPAWLVREVCQERLPHPVDTIFIVSTGDSGCPEIFPDSETGTAAAIWASCVSIILLKLNWFLIAEEIVSTFAFILSKNLSLAASFLFKDSFILAWPKTRSLKEGWFELKFKLKFELKLLPPPWNGGRAWPHPDLLVDGT